MFNWNIKVLTKESALGGESAVLDRAATLLSPAAAAFKEMFVVSNVKVICIFIMQGCFQPCIFHLSSVSKGSHTDFWTLSSENQFWERIIPTCRFYSIFALHFYQLGWENDPSVTTNFVLPWRLMPLCKVTVYTASGRQNPQQRHTTS